jgi:uncharacterized protein YigA (DUF484 family)
MTEHTIPPITEDDIANYLAQTPGFFERHAELLASVQLTSPHGQRAVSLQERQAEMLREKIKGLERRLMDMIRHGNENVVIAARMHRWTLQLLGNDVPRGLPDLVVSGIRDDFFVPQVALRIWDVDAAFADAGFVQGVSEDVKTFASSLATPYCGVNSGFEAVQWLDDAALALSVALVPLRAAPAGPAFGLLVLASPDPQRFQAAMGTDFLEHIAGLAGAALSRLR